MLMYLFESMLLNQYGTVIKKKEVADKLSATSFKNYAICLWTSLYKS